MGVIGAGRHQVTVVDHALGKSGTGTPHVSVLFEDINGDRITWYGYLSDRAIEFTLKALGVLGWDPQEHNGNLATLNSTNVLCGAGAEIVVEEETFEGKTRPKVQWVNELGGGSLEAMAETEAETFAASLRKKILSAPKPKVVSHPGPAKAAEPAAQPAAAGGAPADDFDDDLPF